MGLEYSVGVPPARRFRLLFWLVAWLGALPSLVSGWALLGHFRLETLCAAERPAVTLGQLRDTVRWARLHQWGRVGAIVAGLLVVAWGTAWAFERRRFRALVTALCAAVLLPALTVALWSGRATPWRALEPPIAVGESQVVPAPAEWGGPRWCREHEDELRRLRLIYWLHAAAGTLAVLLTLALTDAASRWRAAKDAAAP